MVEAMAPVPFAMPQFFCIPNRFLGGWGYMYPQIKKIVGMLSKICLKRCVCFYQVAIPQEILKIVSMFV
jgi:hypothetical protein